MPVWRFSGLVDGAIFCVRTPLRLDVRYSLSGGEVKRLGTTEFIRILLNPEEPVCEYQTPELYAHLTCYESP